MPGLLPSMRWWAMQGSNLRHLQGQARNKLPAAPLIACEGGSHWHKERWKQPIRKAAEAAGLPMGVCAYTLRHSVITECWWVAWTR